jgi:hypothetical protein
MNSRPKMLTLCGKKFTVRYNPKRCDGSCDLAKMVMTIGTKIEADVLETILHESLEGIMLLRGNHYQVYAGGNDKVLMSMNHSEFENVVKDLAVVIEEIK